MEDQITHHRSTKRDIVGTSSQRLTTRGLHTTASAASSSCNCSCFTPRSRDAACQEPAVHSEQAQRQQPLLVQRLLEDMRCRSPLERAALLHQQPSSLLASMALSISQQCVAAAVEARQAAIALPDAPSAGLAATARASALQAAAQATERAVWRMRVARKLALAALIKRSKEEQHDREQQQQQQKRVAHDSPSNARDHHQQQQQQQQQLKRKREQEDDAAEGVGDSEEVVLDAAHISSILQQHTLTAAATMEPLR